MCLIVPLPFRFVSSCLFIADLGAAVRLLILVGWSRTTFTIATMTEKRKRKKGPVWTDTV